MKHCEITARDELLSCPGNPLSMTDVHSITHRHDFQIGYPEGEGTLGITGWGCAAGTLEPLTYTRASSAEFCYPILE